MLAIKADVSPGTTLALVGLGNVNSSRPPPPPGGHEKADEKSGKSWQANFEELQVALEGLKILPDCDQKPDYKELVLKARAISESTFTKRFYIRNFTAGKHITLLVDNAGTKAYGYMTYSLVDPEAIWIEQVGIAEEFRGKGLGARLLAWLRDRTKALRRTIKLRIFERQDFEACLVEKSKPPEFEVWMLHSPSPQRILAVSALNGAELREAARPDAPVVANLRRTTILVVAGGVEGEWVRCLLPVIGWVQNRSLRSVLGDEVLEQMNQPDVPLLEVMQQVRLTVSGPEPAGRCWLSSESLKKAVKEKGLHKRIGNGSCHVVHGSFLQDDGWERHTWLTVGGVGIADVTADQFDSVPRLWWPADESRYKPDKKSEKKAESKSEKKSDKKRDKSPDKKRSKSPDKKRDKSPEKKRDKSPSKKPDAAKR